MHVPGGLVGATVSAPGAEPLLILDNESPRPASLVLRGASAVHAVQGFSPGGGAGRARARAARRRRRRDLVRLPANGVLALRFAP